MRAATSQPLFALPMACVGLALAAACAGGGPPAEPSRFEGPHFAAAEAVAPTPWTGAAPLSEPDDFRFVVVSDRTGEHRPGVFESAMPKVELLKPAFVMSVGDLIEGYTEDRAELAAQWDEFAGFLEPLSMPFFYLPGNHDMSNRVMGEVWRERFGPSFYHFRHKDVLFLALNSELFNMVGRREPVQGVEEPAAQLEFVERVLAEHGDARWTMVFVHQPLWDAPPDRIHPDWSRVEELLGERPYTVFAGHHHKYTKQRRHDRSYITLATTGGGSGMRGAAYGEFDHVALVTMKNEGPVIANLMLDGIAGEDIRTKPMRELVGQLGRAVRVAPGRFDGERFWRGTLALRMKNEGATPLRIAGRLEPSRDLEVASERIERVLAPGERVDVPVEVRARNRRGARFATLAPARARWTLSQKTPEGVPIEIESETLLAPGTVHRMTRLRRAIELDGSLAEWGVLRFDASEPWQIDHAEHHAGPDDASFRFDVRRAADALYLGIDVRDDSLVFSEEAIAREQDGLAVTLDARSDPERSSVGSGFFQAIADGTFAKLVVLDALPVVPAHDSVFATFVAPAPEGIRIAAQRHASGYTAEIEVPFLELEMRAGGPWDGVRIEISQRDFDEGESGHTTSWWRPSRFGALASEGSGTFVP